MCQILCLYQKVHNLPEILSYAAGLDQHGSNWTKIHSGAYNVGIESVWYLKEKHQCQPGSNWSKIDTGPYHVGIESF